MLSLDFTETDYDMICSQTLAMGELVYRWIQNKIDDLSISRIKDY